MTLNIDLTNYRADFYFVMELIASINYLPHRLLEAADSIVICISDLACNNHAHDQKDYGHGDPCQFEFASEQIWLTRLCFPVSPSFSGFLQHFLNFNLGKLSINKCVHDYLLVLFIFQ